jgi:hypothetical protein
MDGLQVKYSELLSLAVTQHFYENKVCAKYSTSPVPDIVFYPAGETTALMKRLGLVFRANDNTGGFTVLARTNGTLGPVELLRFAPKEGDKLTFFALLRNPAFLNFNEMPVTTDPGKIFYFSNEVNDLAATRTTLHLSTLAAGVSAADDMIKASGEIYRFHYGVPVGAGAAKVKHLLTGIELDAVSVINSGGQSDLVFDLSSLPAGKCQLLITAVKTDEFYYAGFNAPRPLFAVVELNLSPLIADSDYRITEADKTIQAVKPMFTLTFNNRKATWRYTINLQPSSPLYIELAPLAGPAKATFLSNLKITSNDPAVKFTQLPGATDTSIVFQSDTTLAFREKYFAAPGLKPLSITLRKNTGLMSEAVVKADLPYPSAYALDAVNNPLIYSDIFLTL